MVHTGYEIELCLRFREAFPIAPFCSQKVIKLLSSFNKHIGEGNPTPVLLPGIFHGWRSLVGCSPWGR